MYSHAGFERSSGCTLQFPSAKLFPLHNFSNWECSCQWGNSFVIVEVWWMIATWTATETNTSLTLGQHSYLNQLSLFQKGVVNWTKEMVETCIGQSGGVGFGGPHFGVLQPNQISTQGFLTDECVGLIKLLDHSPKLPYSKGIGSHAAAIPILKVV